MKIKNQVVACNIQVLLCNFPIVGKCSWNAWVGLSSEEHYFLLNALKLFMIVLPDDTVNWMLFLYLLIFSVRFRVENNF